MPQTDEPKRNSQASNGTIVVALLVVVAATLVLAGPAEAQTVNDDRVHMDVSAGIILSKERDDFSKTDPYLALDTEIVVRAPELRDAGNANPQQTYYVAPFVNVRLTSIPIDPSVENQAPAPAEDLEAFLQSHKAAVFQLGTYIGFIPGHLKYDLMDAEGEPRNRALSIGPLVRWSSQSVTGRQKTLRVWNREDDLFDAVTVGGRLAWVEQEGDGLRTLGYVDASWGRFQNFETAVPITAAGEAYRANPTPANAALVDRSDFDVTRGNRLFIEGRMRLPGARFVYVGVDLNNGRGRDDLRFLAGLRFDLGNALEGLISGAE